MRASLTYSDFKIGFPNYGFDYECFYVYYFRFLFFMVNAHMYEADYGAFLVYGRRVDAVRFISAELEHER